MTNLAPFLAGIALATFGASAVFFLKFWRASRDPFFLCFSIACALMAIERLAIVFCEPPPGTVPPPPPVMWVYVVRLIAFVLIFVAALRKNRVRSSK